MHAHTYIHTRMHAHTYTHTHTHTHTYTHTHTHTHIHTHTHTKHTQTYKHTQHTNKGWIVSHYIVILQYYVEVIIKCISHKFFSSGIVNAHVHNYKFHIHNTSFDSISMS